MISLPIQGYAAAALTSLKEEGWGDDPSFVAALNAWQAGADGASGVLLFPGEQRPRVVAGLLALAAMQDDIAAQEGRRDPSAASFAYAAGRGLTAAAARAEAL